MSQRVLTVYIRRHCHLCEQMVHALEPWCAQQALRLELLDVDRDPVLAARFGERVPVLADGEHEICALSLDEAALAARLGHEEGGGELRAAGSYERIYAIVRRIPAGRVATYGQIAAIEGRASARMVGWAMAALPAGSDVPWQRVINARGEVSERAGGGGTARQRERLAAEGVFFDRRGRVDLARAGWEGPEAAWLARNGFHAAPAPAAAARRGAAAAASGGAPRRRFL